MAESMSGWGVPQADIALLLGISQPTMIKHLRAELDQGLAKANAKIGQTMFQMATTPGPHQGRMAIFWAKARMGWREVPSEVTVTLKDERESTEEERLRALALMLARRQTPLKLAG